MRYKIAIKLSTLLLTVLLLLFVASIFASNVILKRQYDKADKSDIYWNYGKILEQPFKHVVIEGGNISGYTSSYNEYIIPNIYFEESKNSSVRVLKNWEGFAKGSIKASVKHDTLFITFPDEKSFGTDYHYREITLVRIFAPEIISIDGHKTSMRFNQVAQKNLAINLSGGSRVQVECLTPFMDSLAIHATDSSVTRVIMSFKYKGKEKLRVNAVDADLKGTSLLDFGHAQINSLHLTASDSAAIMLSGDALRKLKE